MADAFTGDIGVVCPICHGQFELRSGTLHCGQCERSFPIHNGVPILIADERSLFSIADFTGGETTTLESNVAGLKVFLRKMTPRISANDVVVENFKRLATELKARVAKPRVLVIGGGILGNGMSVLTEDADIELVETDVSFGPRTKLICDAHDLPFATASFDCVIAQAVLEHVIDPVRVVTEMQRVLRPGGLVYAETPFMQQVHMGRYDFWRFTAVGHRRLFRWFDEIVSGPVAGPGVALAWSFRYFLLSFATGRVPRLLLNSIAGFAGFTGKYFDRAALLRSRGAYDGGSGYYFMGHLRESPIPDRDIVGDYRGACDSAIGV